MGVLESFLDLMGPRSFVLSELCLTRNVVHFE